MSENCSIRQAVFETKEPGEVLHAFRTFAVRFGVAIVAFDAGRMAGRAHVQAAIDHAARSVSRGTQIANSFEMEALLYASGSRQCQEAVGFGVKPGLNRCFICICPENRDAAAALGTLVVFCDDEDWEQIHDRKAEMLCRLFGITEAELRVGGKDRLRDLVIERVALLDAYR